MPYKLTTIEEDGSKTELKLLANDNTSSPFGFEDRRIFTKGTRLAKELNKMFPLTTTTCEHYANNS